MPSSDWCYRSEEHTSELQSHDNLVCRLLLEKKTNTTEARSTAGRAAPRRGGAAPARECGPGRPGRVRLAGRPAGVSVTVRFFFFNFRPPPEIHPFPLHDPLPI